MEPNAAETREQITDLVNNRWLPKSLLALNSIAVKHGWETEHYIKSKTHGGQLRSTFIRNEWRIYIQWAFKGGILNANVNAGPGTKQKMPKEFGMTDKAMTWVGDLLYDIGEQQ